MNIDLVWAMLRTTRANAPAGITGARRRTYVASLEQAQQMFTAAASVGVATRPLLLFYGLSQGGRAIAAAAKHVTNSDYPLSGHGIKADTSSLAGPITGVQVYADGRRTGSFTRLSGILNSPTWNSTTPVTLGELWYSLPDVAIFLDSTSGMPPLPVSTDEFDITVPPDTNQSVRLIVTGVPHALMPDIQASGPAPDLVAFLDRYPTLAGYTTIRVMGIYPGKQGGTIRLIYPASHSDWRLRKADAEAHTTRYQSDDRFVFPAVGGNTASLHPIMTWWAVLFALSMLARYHPEAWADHISVDSSKMAVAIERLLTEALTVVPELLLRTIVDVSA
jgi:hypothetical protein